MMKKTNKIKKVLFEMRSHYKNHGFKYAFSFFVTKILRKYKYKTILRAIDILDKKFGYIIDEISNENFVPNEECFDVKQFYVYWAQGAHKINALGKHCIKLLKKNYPDYKVFLLDDDNFQDYANIPSHIIQLYKDGKITVQTFSDILRFNLLYQRGGIWVDSTLLLFGKYPLIDEIRKIGFVSLNHYSEEKNEIRGKVYDVRFTTFFMGTFKNNQIMKCCAEFYNKYYEKYDIAIDYFMIDYILILCAKRNLCNDMLNKISFWEGDPFYLAHMIKNSDFDEEEVFKIPQKMDWRNFNEDDFLIHFKNTI